METGATLVIVGGSALGIPLSTTHCQVGATMGVGFCETKSIKNIKGVNLGLFAKIVAGWIMTLVFTAGLAIIVYTIVAVVLFPRIEAYSCGDLAAPLSLAATAMTLMTEYSQPADLQNYLTTEFKKLDTDGDEFLSQIELEVNTAKQVAKDGISSFGSGKKLSQQQFINWRCGGTGLETLQDGCVPICANPDHIVEPIECKLHVQEKPSFQLIAKYNFEEEHAGCVAPPTTTTTAPAEQ
jgi:sodium-dependent phosphate transporter